MRLNAHYPPIAWRAVWPRSLGAPLVAAIAALVYGAGCAAGEDPGLPAAPTLGAAAAAEPACADGAERACHVPIAVQGRVVTCYEGIERCAAGAWGPCGDGALSAFELPRAVAGLGAEAVTETVECDGNICDPNCRAFYQAPEVAVETPPGEEIFSWTAGSIADLRAKGLVKKAFEEPCSSGFDCQFNHHCDDPITHPRCTHSKCKPGLALDPHCEDGYIDPSSSNQESCVGMICDVAPDCCVRSYAGTCPRDPCITGVPFKSDCDADVTAVCAALPSCCGVPIGGADPVVREAEQYDVIVARSGQTWVQIADPAASGGIAFRAEPDNGITWARNRTNKSPSLVVTANFGVTGTWYVWVRGRAGGGTVASSDTVHIGLDDTIPTSSAIIGPFGSSYSWVGTMSSGTRATLNVASKGNHEIDVYMHEDGFVVDMVYLTQNGAFSPPVGFLPAAGGGGIGVWSPDCVAKYEAVTGVDCGGGAWDEDCVALVDPVCNATCGVYEDDTCEHSPCDTSGAALEPTCHPCVSEICRISPTCCITGWSSACANLVASACDLTCPIDRKIAPPEAGQCLPWRPGEQDPGCIGPDLSISVPCEGLVPICNHGTQTAAAPIRIIYYSANSSHYTNDDPDQTKTDGECIVDQDVKPGHCVELDVTSATCSFGQNKTVMVNPPKFLATDPEIAECAGTAPAFAGRGRTDNWALYRDDITCEAPACAEQDTTSAFRRVYLYFMVDKSGTMIAARWEGMKQALETFFASPEADTLHVGMEFFPLDNSVPEQGDGCADITVGLCDPTRCANPMVPMGELTVAPSDPQELLLRTAIESVSPAGPTGWTSTYPALSGAILAQKNARAAAPGEVYATVLVTDGYPSACESSTAELAKLALDGYVNNDILTYTIGMPSADIPSLNRIAFAGGTRTAFVVEDDNTLVQDLLDALFTISRNLASCDFTVSGGPNVDPKTAEVVYAPGDGSLAQILPKVSGYSPTCEGWYFDDPADPTSAMLCPTTCSLIQNDSNGAVDVRIDCAPLYEGDVFSEAYEASCPPNTGPQWSLFVWDTDVDPGAAIAFRARAANSEAELVDAPWAVLGTATETLEVCGLGGPLDQGCPRNLYAALDARATYPVLELEAALEPSSSGIGGAVLNNWEITYTCVDIL